MTSGWQREHFQFDVEKYVSGAIMSSFYFLRREVTDGMEGATVQVTTAQNRKLTSPRLPQHAIRILSLSHWNPQFRFLRQVDLHNETVVGIQVPLAINSIYSRSSMSIQDTVGIHPRGSAQRVMYRPREKSR